MSLFFACTLIYTGIPDYKILNRMTHLTGSTVGMPLSSAVCVRVCRLMVRVLFFLSKDKDKIGSNLLSALTFDLSYDLQHPTPCSLCPILNNYNDPSQRSFRTEVREIALNLSVIELPVRHSG